MPGVRFLLLFLLPDEIVSIFWTGAGLAQREREREEEEEWRLEGEGTAVPGRAVRWYPRGLSAAGVKIRERVEEVGLCRSSIVRIPCTGSIGKYWDREYSWDLFVVSSLSFSRGSREYGRCLEAVMGKIIN